MLYTSLAPMTIGNLRCLILGLVLLLGPACIHGRPMATNTGPPFESASLDIVPLPATIHSTPGVSF
jgi:hypothetical protein